MNCRCAAAALLLVPAVGVAQLSPRVSYVQLASDCVRDVVYRDFDGDNKPDLIVAVGSCEGGAAARLVPRRLQIHLRRDDRPTFLQQPDRELSLVHDVVAWAIGDVHPNPGAEVVLFSATRAVAVFWRADAEQPSYRALTRTRLLWQPPSPRTAFAWQPAITDVDGDGLDDLVIAEPDGYRVSLQRRDGAAAADFSTEFILQIPPRPVSRRQRSAARFSREGGGFSLSFSVGSNDSDNSDRAQLIEVDNRVPSPQWIDWDGDGDLDLCALAGRRLWVWTQQDRAFATAPTRALAVPPRESTLLDISYSAQLCDIDGDHRAELLMVSGRSQDGEVQSSVAVYRQDDHGVLIGPDHRAADKLRLQGFVGTPRLDDVDGDGKPDLAIGSLRPDLIGALGGNADTVEAQINVFRSRFTATGGRFQRPVALVQKIQLEASAMRSPGRLTASFFADVDGDGLRDLLLRTDRDSVQVMLTRQQGRRLQLDSAAWQLSIDEKAEVHTTEGRAEIVIEEPEQIVHVEFR